MTSPAITTERHDASAQTVDGFAPLFVASCRVDGRIVDTAEFLTDEEASAWCDAQVRLRRSA